MHNKDTHSLGEFQGFRGYLPGTEDKSLLSSLLYKSTAQGGGKQGRRSDVNFMTSFRSAALFLLQAVITLSQKGEGFSPGISANNQAPSQEK